MGTYMWRGTAATRAPRVVRYPYPYPYPYPYSLPFTTRTGPHVPFYAARRRSPPYVTVPC